MTETPTRQPASSDAVLREALRPFALYAEQQEKAWSHCVNSAFYGVKREGAHQITYGDFRRARAALSAASAPSPAAGDAYELEALRGSERALLALWELLGVPGQAAAIQKIAALSSPAAGSDGWQPIETAPKDGTRIWLGDSKNVVTGYWSPPVGAWRCDWQVGQAGDKPTHWRPLPAAPTPSTASGGE